MDDGPLGTAQGLEGPLDELFAALDQDLDGHVVGDEAALDDLALEVVIGLRGRGEPDFDLLEPDVDQSREEPQLALRIHGVDQCLVAVTQVDAGPLGGDGALAVRPGAVGEHQGYVGAVEVERHGRHVARHGQAPGRTAVGGGVLVVTHRVLPWWWCW